MNKYYEMNRPIWNFVENRRYYIVVFVMFIGIELYLWKTSQTTDVLSIKPKLKPRPYYLKNGTIYPQPAIFSKKLGKRDTKLFPSEDPDSDRIENQLMFVPPNYEEIRKSNKTKLIVFPNGRYGWWFNNINTKDFFSVDKNCPVSTCTISNKREDAEKADLIIFIDQLDKVNYVRKPNQIIAFSMWESPVFYSKIYSNSIIYNWTITYRHDSTIPIPYSKWIYYDSNVKEMPQTINYAANKTKKIAWLISDCDRQNDRLNIGHALQKYIQVDIYGKCGNMNCNDTNACLDTFERDYKFYLAFENSNCVDYITEKLFRNALNRTILPIVLGARREDYERQAPHGSFIFYEDFASPKALANYLNKLDQDDDLYNSYFKWKGTGEFFDSIEHFWCRLCAMLHDDYSISLSFWYEDINKWWLDDKTWRRGLWRDSNK